ncbi:TPA: hypothetical protein HA249_00840 [Candidatus Woesearchaeota archaeon]|nr:hypothetical protein [Candidatus Woesearchaeota archaeon]HIH47888.1 hypothetical protein [Candidatus Woesearchaeota archaeon]HII88640.1 hypothetical protein [Candidatus Woesearchaeota archaeon]
MEQPTPQPTPQSAPLPKPTPFGAEKRNIQRETAFKLGIKDVVEGTYAAQEGWKPNYLMTRHGKVMRINLMGVIVSKANTDLLSYDFIMIDDGTARVTIRSFDNMKVFKDFEVGQIVNVIGKPREYAREIYVVPETIQRMDDKTWLEVRKKEMESYPYHLIPKETKEEKQQQNEEIIIEEVKDGKEASLDKLLALIKSLDKGAGVEIEEIMLKSEQGNPETLIKTLLEQGDIFEIKPGRVKVL